MLIPLREEVRPWCEVNALCLNCSGGSTGPPVDNFPFEAQHLPSLRSHCLLNPLGCCRAFEAHGCQARCALTKLARTGGLRDVDRRSLTLRSNAPPEISSTTGPPCLCQIPSHIIDDVTAAVRVGAVPPVLQWQYRRLVHYPFTILKYLSTYGCSPDEFLGSVRSLTPSWVVGRGRRYGPFSHGHR
jgi:hypothetical protein